MLIRYKNLKYLKTIIVTLLLILLSAEINAGENWKIFIDKKLQSDEAIKVALEELTKAGLDFSINFIITDDDSQLENNSILVGNETRNEIVKNLAAKNLINLSNQIEAQAFQIITTEINSNIVVVVSGGSILGEIYRNFLAPRQAESRAESSRK